MARWRAASRAYSSPPHKGVSTESSACSAMRHTEKTGRDHQVNKGKVQADGGNGRLGDEREPGPGYENAPCVGGPKSVYAQSATESASRFGRGGLAEPDSEQAIIMRRGGVEVQFHQHLDQGSPALLHRSG
eukprot:CAMPEP_0183444392 /NCGR_PEP_ID=MMETSP0370-20130417/94854_1 /TAXON_ID=268820 /ORGANISM="Peridinium aciculiferum, Strain PAER-2" /LENGTH=130 /DNA_ID=CAMNT_0025634723 /DNA_START=30 /DNA_END=420 /DNA_ORIENTATION=-